MTSFALTIDGHPVDATGVDPLTPLLHFLRDRGLSGTKEGCAEGECGACAVVLVRASIDGHVRYVPMNSCLVLMGSVFGQEITTVQGVAPTTATAPTARPSLTSGLPIAGQTSPLHPVQEVLVTHAASQCGFCTPGFVMSMFAEYYREGRKAGDYDPEVIGGNLCRCTGYRPIRDALRSLGTPTEEDEHRKRLKQPAPKLGGAEVPEGTFFARPTTLDEAFSYQEANPDALWIAGGTDLVVGINQSNTHYPGLISLEAIDALRTIEETDDTLSLGAAIPLSELEDFFHQRGAAGNDDLAVFKELFVLFSSRLIRNRATLGGNLGNASPIGDSPPVLLSLDARLVLASKNGERTVPLSEFFTGYRETVLRPGELLKTIVLPKPFPDVSRFYKVSKRHMDDISTVAAGFSIWLSEGVVQKACLAFGGVAATPARALNAETLLVGRPLEAHADVLKALRDTFTPMTDHRGSAAYRKEMVPMLFEKFCAEQTRCPHREGMQ